MFDCAQSISPDLAGINEWKHTEHAEQSITTNRSITNRLWGPRENGVLFHRLQYSIWYSFYFFSWIKKCLEKSHSSRLTITNSFECFHWRGPEDVSIVSSHERLNNLHFPKEDGKYLWYLLSALSCVWVHAFVN